jgi:P27 family predicted phage terminase small subunit
LDAAGKKLWRTWHARLSEAGLVTELDEAALARYCALAARWMDTELFLQQHGTAAPLRDTEGTITSVALFPQVGLLLKLSEILLRLEQHFGMTPAARASLAVPKKEGPPHGNAKDKLRFFSAT